MKPQVMWFIQGVWSNGYTFLYVGGYLTRKAAIEAHERMSGKSWAWHKRRRDRAVKCVVKLHPKGN